jgi:hypothetical protein
MYFPQYSGTRFIDLTQAKIILYQNKQYVRSVVWSAVGRTSVAQLTRKLN